MNEPQQRISLLKVLQGIKGKRISEIKTVNTDKSNGTYDQEGLSDPGTPGYITGSGFGPELGSPHK